MDVVVLACLDVPDRTHREVDRACLLARSLDRFLNPEEDWTIRVVADDHELDEVRRVLRPYRLDLQFHAHSEFLAEFPPGIGWRKQQFLKLLAARRVESPFFLSIDCDHLLTRPLSHSDLVVGGRSVVTPEPRAHHAGWWDGPAQILKVPRVGEAAITISCVCMATEAAVGLLDRLEALYGDGWVDVLLDRHDWVDYSLYYTYANAVDPAGRYHVHGPLLGVGESIWHVGDIARWSAASAFHGPHFFVCLQSNTNVSLDLIRELTAPYIGPWDDRPTPRP